MSERSSPKKSVFSAKTPFLERLPTIAAVVAAVWLAMIVLLIVMNLG